MAFTTLSNGCSNEEFIYEWQELNSCYRCLEYSSSQHKNVIHHNTQWAQQDSDSLLYYIPSNVHSKPMYPVSSSILLVHYCTVSITNKCLILCYIVYIFLSC